MSVDRGRPWSWYLVYRGQSGQWAQLFHRLTGLGVVLFLLLHIVDIALLGWGPDVYNSVTAIYHQPVLLILQILLMGAVLYHAINGIRVTLIDFWDKAVLNQDKIFWVELVIFLVLFIPGTVIIVSPAFR